GSSELLQRYPNYMHQQFDLQRTDELESVITRSLEQVDHRSMDIACLINNAAMLEPLLPIQKCSAKEIASHIQVTLIAPMILTSVFINLLNIGMFEEKSSIFPLAPAVIPIHL